VLHWQTPWQTCNNAIILPRSAECFHVLFLLSVGNADQFHVMLARSLTVRSETLDSGKTGLNRVSQKANEPNNSCPWTSLIQRHFY